MRQPLAALRRGSAAVFPVSSLAEGLRQDLSPTAHMLIRLRFFHPFIAIGVSAFLVMTASIVNRRLGSEAGRFASSLIGLVIAQLGLGTVNLLAHAPIGLQIVHLLLSNLIWIALVLMALSSLDPRADGQPA